MANKKAEILTMDGQVVSPITLATNVLLDDGRTAQELLDSRDESMFSPTIATSSSISKVGQGDNVDFSENVIDGAYKSCVLKGKTLVNYNAEGDDRNEYVCMPSVEGQNVTVNDTVEGKVKSAILKGQTLVNLLKQSNKITVNANGTWITNKTNMINNSMIKPSTTYTLITYVHNNTIADGNGYIVGVGGANQTNYIFTGNQIIPPQQTGVFKKLLTTKTDTSLDYRLQQVMYNNSTQGTIVFSQVLLEGDYTNADIPYFEGMQSVKLPVLKTTGKNLLSKESLRGYHQDIKEIDGWLIADNGDFGGNIISKALIEKGKSYTLSTRIKTFDGGTAHYCFSHHGENDFNYLGGNNPFNGVITFTATETTYIDVWLLRRGITGSVHYSDVQLEEGSVATSYEPYKTNILTVNEDVTLRGIGDVKDTLDCLTGELTQRIGEYQITGEENWQFSPGVRRLQIQNPTFIPNIKCGAFACDKLQAKQSNDGSLHSTNGTYYIGYTSDNWLRIILGEDLTSLEQGKEWLKANKPTIQYQLKTESIKTVVLSDNVLYSYKDTTHYTCSSEDGSLIPTLVIEEGVKYEAIIKPSTKYSVVFNRTEVASGLTVDLGGATVNVVSTTLGKNIVQITTLPTLSHNYVIFKGLGNVIKDAQVIEGDVVGDEPYFEGICDCKSPILSNIGKNLFDANEFKRVFGSNVEIGLDGTIVSLGDIKGGNHNLGFHSPINIALKPNTKYTLCLFNLNTSGQIIGVEGCLSTCNYELSMSNVAINSVGYKVFTTNSQNYKDGVSFKVITGATTGEKAQYQIMIVEGEVSHETYSPYKSNTTTFNQKDDKTIVLRSLPSGVCDTLNVETGEYVQRIGEVLLDGSEEWAVESYLSNDSCIYFKSNDTINITSNAATTTTVDVVVDKLGISSYTKQLTTKTRSYFQAWTSHFIGIERNSLETNDVNGIKRWLSQNPITVQYPLETPIITTIDLKQHPYAYKDGYISLSSNSEEVSLTPTIEYSLIANRLGQIQSNQKMVEKQQAQIDELESMVITNLVNTQYQQALNEIKLGVK